ncbi:hypothetical protein OG21DRAFT_1500901 [Imleria badia]|nr:hypothetical protein OG21DRAFT_1500901 [Imleria badia]
MVSWHVIQEGNGDRTRACEHAKKYLQRPFEYALQKALSGSVAPSMVHDALQQMEEKGMSPEQSRSWMDHLKEASGTAFLAAAKTSNVFLMYEGPIVAKISALLSGVARYFFRTTFLIGPGRSTISLIRHAVLD